MRCRGKRDIRTEGSATTGQLGTKGGVGDTPEHLLQSRVLLEVAWVIGIRAFRSATRRGAGTAVLFREDDTSGDTTCDENSERCYSTDDLGQ